MPVKHRKPKARRDPVSEAQLWATYFDIGCFLLAGTGEQLGVTDETADDAAREAWARLGRLDLDQGIGPLGDDAARQGRWALETFGEPNDRSAPIVLKTPR